MKFIKYETKEEFLENNLSILLREEARNEKIIGLIMEHDSEKVNRWLLGRIEDENDVKLIFIVDDDRNGLLLYSLDKILENEVIEFLIDNIVRLNVDLKDILVSKENAKNIANSYINETGKSMLDSEYRYMFKLSKFNEKHILNEGEKVERLEENDENLKCIEELIKDMNEAANQDEDCTPEEIERIGRSFLRKGVYVFRNQDNEIVCQAITVRKQVNGCSLGGIITLKKHRGKGYAKRCVYEVCNKLLESNYEYIVLHVKPDNDAAISVYKKIGFEQIDELEKIKFV